jgi:hypothetical protein
LIRILVINLKYYDGLENCQNILYDSNFSNFLDKSNMLYILYIMLTCMYVYKLQMNIIDLKLTEFVFCLADKVSHALYVLGTNWMTLPSGDLHVYYCIKDEAPWRTGPAQLYCCHDNLWSTSLILFISCFNHFTIS